MDLEEKIAWVLVPLSLVMMILDSRTDPIEASQPRKASRRGHGRAGFGDVDDAAVEVAVFAGDPLIDLIGDDVGDTAPVLPGRRIGKAGELLLGEDVP